MRTRPVVTLLLAAMWSLALTGCSNHAPLPVVPEVDLERYLGQWHEVARLPNRFQTDCEQTTANYTRQGDGKVAVLNQCVKNGQADRAEGVAWVVGPEPAKLRVRFFWPFSGAYWIIALDNDYQWAMVGHPSREYLWILARSPELEQATLDRLKSRATALGFDLGPLIVSGS